MKNFIYIIIGVMSLVFLFNITAIQDDPTLKMVKNGSVVEINPIY